MMVRKSFLIIGLVCLFSSVFAQMSDEQVVNFLQEAQKQGKTQQEMLMMLVQKGVTKEQLMRIKENFGEEGMLTTGNVGNVDRMRTGLQKDNKGNTGDIQQDKRFLKEWHTVPEEKRVPQNFSILDSLGKGLGDQERLQKAQKNREKQVFGRDVFSNKFLTFEPNLNIATPQDYVLGPGDEVIVDLWGDSEYTLRQYISPDGYIVDEKIGLIYLNGLKIEEADDRLKQAFGRSFSALNGPNATTFIKLSLGEIRSIRVNVMGEVVMPGTYTLPALASLFHALYSAGGVNDIGTLRNIKVSRGGKEIARVDIYQYLLNGRNDLDISLKDGDVIVVSPYANFVSVTGKVKRPMIYELRQEETLGDLLNFCGGFKGEAYKESLRVIRKSGREHQVYNVGENDFSKFILTDGDAVSVDSVISRFENKVEVKGAVYREGLYALGEEILSVRTLVEKAEGLREDAFPNRAVLYREKPDLTMEVVSLNISGIVNGETEDVPLRKNDVLYIPSIFDLRENYSIRVHGAVIYPGTYKYVENMTLEDVVIQCGGLKESASTVKIDVARRIKNPKSTTVGSLRAENYTFTLKDGLVVEGGKRFVLQPFDEVYVRNSPGYQEQQNVYVDGEVLFEGGYAISVKGERLSDLVKKAGGLTPEAYPEGARLIRKLSPDERAKVETMLKLAKQNKRDSIDVNSLDLGESYYVGIELQKAIQNPGSDYDVVLREGDRLVVPQYSGTVKISGAVMYPNTVVYRQDRKLKYYIEQGGGFASRAKKRKVFIVYMNGTVSKSRAFSKATPRPGCEIIVPLKPTRKGIGLAEIMSLTSSTTSIAAMVTSILNSTK